MMVLIVGLLPFDSGKTSLAVSLISEALERGMDVGVVKPVTAFSGWYQYSSVLRSVEMGKLVGEDVYRLHVHARSGDPIELESPVVFMHMPPDPERVEWKSSYYTAMSLNEQIVALRIGSNHHYVPANLNRLTGAMRRVARRLIETLKPTPLDDVGDVLLKLGEFANDSVEEIAKRHEMTVVESYNNASAPTWSSLNADAVVLVAPSKVAIYEGERYRKAVELLLKPPWLVSSEEVVSLLSPLRTMEIEPTTRREGAWARGLLELLQVI